MAKITIKEVDNSSASVVTGTENIVYVPGYSIKGPVNTPTLCESVSDFKRIFGNVPYVYKHNQYLDGTTASQIVANQGDYDKSYLYAIELLNQGLPVLFERVFDGQASTAALKINLINKVRVARHQTEDAEYIATCTTLSAQDWVLTKVVAGVEEVVSDVGFIENDDKTLLQINSETEQLEDVEVPIQTLSTEVKNEDEYFIINAKYPGAYGSDIKVSIQEITDEDQYPRTEERLFELLINDNRYVINFDISSNYYIENKLANDPNVNVVASFTNDYISSNLYGIINVDNRGLEYTNDGEDEMSFASIRSVLKANENAEIPSPYYALRDKTIYDVKFITSSVFSSMDANDATIANLMLDCAAHRGDALAIVDMLEGVNKESYLSIVSNAFPTTYVNGEDRNKYATMIAPSVKVTLSTTGTKEWMPASYAYLYALASSIKDNPIWYAVSGVVRGVISNFSDVEFVVDERLAKQWQSETSISINPIQNVRPYGYCIYGNRTLYRNLEGLKDSSFTNIRLLVNEAKKVTRKAISRLMFESNDSVLWNHFKSLVEPTLQKMKSDRGITDYKITKVNSNKKATVEGIIKIMPVEAVENFDITFSLKDNTVVVD